MIPDMFASPFLLAIVMALAGFAFGIAYFLTLRRTTALLAGGGWSEAAGLTLARIAVAAGLFALAARLGALPLLAGFMGFLLARMVALRTLGKAV